jgi:hypothetical protein
MYRLKIRTIQRKIALIYLLSALHIGLTLTFEILHYVYYLRIKRLHDNFLFKIVYFIYIGYINEIHFSGITRMCLVTLQF